MTALLIYIHSDIEGIRLEPASVYQQTLANARRITESYPGEKLLYYPDYPNWNDDWDVHTYLKRIQRGDTAGDAYASSFDEAFAEGHHPVMLIMADFPGLTSELLEHTEKLLATKDIIIGVTESGRLYLLGMKEYIPEFLDSIRLVSAPEAAEIINAVVSSARSYEILPVLRDQDLPGEFQTRLNSE